MSSTELKTQICDALAAWIRQRPGLEPGNYDAAGYRSDSRRISRDKRDAETLLAAVKWRDSITAEDLIEAAKHAFSGRLTMEIRKSTTPSGPFQRVVIDYTTGQYWPTEYRAAAAAVLASALWAYTREKAMPSKIVSSGQEFYPHAGGSKNLVSAGEWLRSHFRKEFGSALQRRWFN